MQPLSPKFDAGPLGDSAELLSETKKQKLTEAILSTLAFFSLYDLPISLKRLHELLLDYSADLQQVQEALESLVADNKVNSTANLYSLGPWKAFDLRDKQIEISKKWSKIDRYFFWLSVLPFARGIAVINSLSLGTADADSDIDFFVITQKNRLYTVRSIIIVLFRFLGVYKTKHKIKDRFCFGFFVSQDNLNLEQLLIKPIDPYFWFWLVSMRPITGGQQYWQLMQENAWLNQKFPNFSASLRLPSVKEPKGPAQTIKFLLEIIFWLPATMIEPLLRRIHIKHTFKLAENNTAASTTIANKKMLKLHALDVREVIKQQYQQAVESLNNE